MAKQTSSRPSSTAPKRKRTSEAPAPISQVILKPQQAPEKRPPTHEEIAARAFEVYQRRGGQGGTPESDWLTAESELSN